MNNNLKDSKQNETSNQTSFDFKKKWRHLNLEVSHSQGNLKLLTQRIIFCLDHKLTEFLAGALQDLFMTLGDKGWPLRHRLYKLCSPLLTYSERSYFQKWLADTTDNELKDQSFLGSVYMSQNKAEKGTANTIDTIQSHSHSLIEQGSLASAQVLLEDACLKDHKAKLVNQELRDFYFYSRNEEALSAFVAKLHIAKKKPLKPWLDLQNESKSW